MSFFVTQFASFKVIMLFNDAQLYEQIETQQIPCKIAELNIRKTLGTGNSG